MIGWLEHWLTDVYYGNAVLVDRPLIFWWWDLQTWWRQATGLTWWVFALVASSAWAVLLCRPFVWVDPETHCRRWDMSVAAEIAALSVGAVLSHIMQWGLNCGATLTLDHGGSQGPVRHLYFYVESELYARVEKAATAAGMYISPWLRQMVRRIATTDVPASWQEERIEERSHDSRTYDRRYLLRLDHATVVTLQDLLERFAVSKAEIIRQLVAQANPDDFPQSWHTRATERRVQQARQRSTTTPRKPTS